MAETVDATPVYMRIRRRIEERIERGIYPTGSMIPSEKDLAEECGTTRLTIRSAVDELVRRGQIRRVRGKGAFVAQKVPVATSEQGAFASRSVLRAASVRPHPRAFQALCGPILCQPVWYCRGRFAVFDSAFELRQRRSRID